MLETGITGKITKKVTQGLSACELGSGELEVFATPAMIALIEETAWRSVADRLDEGCGTVGTSVNITHTAATPIGMDVTCKTTLVEIDRRRLVFEVGVFDESGEIGKGTHERFIVNNEKFQAKADAKAGK